MRVDSINPLFALLGWDVENRQGAPKAYREVVYEDRVKVRGGTKAPEEYGFYAGARRCTGGAAQALCVVGPAAALDPH